MCLKCISYLWTICLRLLIGFAWAPHSQPLREGQLQVTPGRILRRKPHYTRRALVLQELLGRAGGQFGRPAGLPAPHHRWFLLMVTGASLWCCLHSIPTGTLMGFGVKGVQSEVQRAGCMARHLDKGRNGERWTCWNQPGEGLWGRLRVWATCCAKRGCRSRESSSWRRVGSGQSC